MTQITFKFTEEEVEVLETLLEFHAGSEIPEYLNQEAYDSLFDKVFTD